MRLIKMLGLAAVMATAAMAFVGATNAAADTMCTAETADTGECPVANRLALPQNIKAVSVGKAVLLAEGLETKCNSTAEGKAETNDGPNTALLGKLTNLSFTACEGVCKKVKGEKANNLPYNVKAVASTLTWHFTSGGSGALGATLEGCTIFNVSCTYEAEGGTALLAFDPPSGTTAAQLLAVKVPLKRSSTSSSLCPEKGAWDATYKFTEPNNGFVWLTAKP